MIKIQKVADQFPHYYHRLYYRINIIIICFAPWELASHINIRPVIHKLPFNYCNWFMCTTDLYVSVIFFLSKAVALGYDFIPNLDERAANFSFLNGLCTVRVSLAVCQYNARQVSARAYFSNKTGPFRASTRPYFLFLVEMS